MCPSGLFPVPYPPSRIMPRVNELHLPVQEPPQLGKAPRVLVAGKGVVVTGGGAGSGGAIASLFPAPIPPGAAAPRSAAGAAVTGGT